MGPSEGRRILFGRNRPAVHLCVGEHDLSVSRVHGVFVHRQGRWWLVNSGGLGIRMNDERLVAPEDEPYPLPVDQTMLTIEGLRGRRHLIEVLVTGADSTPGTPAYSMRTERTTGHRIDREERLVVVALAQAYLRGEPDPRPESWNQVGALLADLYPDDGWTEKKAEHKARGLRLRLDVAGRPGMVARPGTADLGSSLKERLVRELIMSNTIGSKDLALIDDPDDPDHPDGPDGPDRPA